MKIKNLKNRAETLGDYNNAVNTDTGSPKKNLYQWAPANRGAGDGRTQPRSLLQAR